MDIVFKVLVIRLLKVILYRLTFTNYKDFDQNWKENTLNLVRDADRYIDNNEAPAK
jgi:hypothetical protein